MLHPQACAQRNTISNPPVPEPAKTTLPKPSKDFFFSPEPTADPAARRAKSEQVHESAPISFTELTHEATVVPEPKPVNKSDQVCEPIPLSVALGILIEYKGL